MQHATNEPMSKKLQTIRKEPQLHLQIKEANKIWKETRN